MPALARLPVIVSNAKPPVQRKPKGPGPIPSSLTKPSSCSLPTSLERKWTAAEDEVLINAVNSYGRFTYPCLALSTSIVLICTSAPGEKINWIKIAELIDGRSNKACRKRWIHSLNPTLRKGRWTLQEDELLLKAIRKHGHCWHKVAKYLPGRTDDQAAKRFREKLDPGIAKTPWTEEEDRTLLDMWKKVGCRWNLISRELNGRPAVHCRNRYASLKRIQKTLDPEGRNETPLVAVPFPDPTNTPNLSTPSLSPNCSPCSTPPRQPSPTSPFPDAGETEFASNLGFPGHTDAHELQQIEEINSLLVGGEQRGLPHQSMPAVSSTLYHLRLNESRSHPFHRGSAQPPKLSFANHPNMRVLSPGQLNPARRASAPQLGFHVSSVTSQSIPRQLPFLYSGVYSSPDIPQHSMVTHQQSDAATAFDMSSFNPLAGTSSSRPTTSGSDFSNSSAGSMISFASDSTSPSAPPEDVLSFGFYQDANAVKMENAVTDVDLVGWNSPGLFCLDTMGGFDTFGNVPQC